MRSRRAVVGGLVVVAAAIVLVVGAVLLSGSDATPPIGAVAAVQDDHLPVDPIETIPARIDLIADTGVTTTRVDIFWSATVVARPDNPTDPGDPAYDFARADLIMQGLAERDITPIVSVYSAPKWAAGRIDSLPGSPVNRAAPDPDDFGAFMQALATRYDGGFTGPGGDTLPRVEHFEIWNEPNLSGFLIPDVPPGVSAEKARLDVYAEMVRTGYAGIKTADPEAQVIVGVGGPRSSTTPTGVGALEWLDGLAERDVPLDAYSQHVYPAAPPKVETDVVPSWSSIGRVLEALDAWRPNIPLYITEAGYTTSPTRFRPNAQVTEEQQAQYLEEIYSLPQLRTDRIRTVVWFNLEDNADWPAGLLRDADLSRKPSYDAFREVVKDQDGARLP